MAINPDWRHISNGKLIPTATYCDQPYIVKTDDGAWLCLVTTGAGREGDQGQHIVSMRSTDFGETWMDVTAVEPPDGPEASYVVILKVPQGYPNAGRIYCFYNHNTDRVPWVKADDPPFKGGKCYRVDSLGHFVFKYSDDHGKTWSQERYDIPVREMDIDRQNAYGGSLRFFWNVGKPFVYGDSAFVSLHKVGGFGEGFFTSSEGVLLKSANLFTESDPARVTWETLPDGDFGLRTPEGGGSIAEEQSYVVLSDGAFYAVYRTIDGHPAYSYSRDGGHTWDPPQYLRYANGNLIKHPRAANFVWKCENGNYLYWFHNHGGRFIREHPQQRSIAYNDRNPVWLCGGVEVDGPQGRIIQWSQPEILLYDDDPYIRMSYPDLVEENGRYFITETQKDIARVHDIDASFLEGLWAQFTYATVSRDGLVLEYKREPGQERAAIDLPEIPHFTRRSQRADHGCEHTRAGFTLDLLTICDIDHAPYTLLSNQTENDVGFRITYTAGQTVVITLNDGRTENHWESDPFSVIEGRSHHIVINVDGGPHIISFIVDGVLSDGGDLRQFGWGRFSPDLQHVNGDKSLHIAPQITSLRIYNRILRTSEAIGNYRASLRA